MCIHVGLENNVSSYLSVQLGSDDTNEIVLGYSPRMESKKHVCNFWCRQMCSTCVYPEGKRTHYPQPGRILLQSDPSLKGQGLEPQCRQMGDA